MKFEFDWRELNQFAEELGDVSRLERQMQFTAKVLASTLLKVIKNFTPVGNTYQLVNGWNGNDFAIRQTGEGFEIWLVNSDPKATWVNDGHRVRNRADGPYLEVHRRVKVPTAHRWQVNKSNMYVFGHFFVERGILEMANSKQIEQLIMDALQGWWDSL